MTDRFMNGVVSGVDLVSRRSSVRALLAALCALGTLAGHALAQTMTSAFGYSADNPVAVVVACCVAAFVQASKERQVGGRSRAPTTTWGHVRLRALDALGAAMLVYIIAGVLHLLGQRHPVWLALGMAAVGFAPGGSVEALFVWVFRRGERAAQQRANDLLGAGGPVGGQRGGGGPASPPAPAQGPQQGSGAAQDGSMGRDGPQEGGA